MEGQGDRGGLVHAVKEMEGLGLVGALEKEDEREGVVGGENDARVVAVAVGEDGAQRGASIMRRWSCSASCCVYM